MKRQRKSISYEELKKILKENGLNIRKFADSIGVHPVTVSNWRFEPIPLWAYQALKGVISTQRAKKAKEIIENDMAVLKELLKAISLEDLELENADC